MNWIKDNISKKYTAMIIGIGILGYSMYTGKDINVVITGIESIYTAVANKIEAIMAALVVWGYIKAQGKKDVESEKNNIYTV